MRNDETGHARGDDQNVGQQGELSKVAGFLVADAHSRILLHQHERRRLADDVARADHHDILAFQIDAFMLQNFLHAIGSARREHGIAGDQAPDIVEMESIHIFVHGNALQHVVNLDVRG